MIKLKKRYSVVLMSVSSLPSPFGIGGFGEEFKRFIDYLVKGGFSAMQVLIALSWKVEQNLIIIPLP